LKKLFKNFGVGKKISALLIISVIVVVLIAVGFAIVRFMNLMQEQSIEQAIKGVQGLEQQISVRRDNADGVAYLLSLNPEVGAGIADKDRTALKQVSDKMLKDIKTDFIIFTDKNGDVLYRSDDSSKFGDSISSRDSIKSALSGKGVALVERGGDIPLIISGSYPVMNEAGIVIGTVSSGYRLDKFEMLDDTKFVVQTDLTIFCDNIRISTTIENNGQRVVGTELDPVIANIVLNQKTDYTGEADILGNKFITYYLPIMDASNNSIGVLFAGKSMEQFNAELAEIIWFIAGSSLAAVIFVTIISMFIVKKTMTNPIKNTAQLANELALGNLDHPINIKNKDEIGDLASILNVNVRDVFKRIEEVRVDIDNASKQVAVGTQQLADGSQSISSGATEQASSLEQLTASVSQIAEQSNQNAISSNKANQLSMDAKNSAVQGNELMNNLQKAMQDINKSSLDISKIIKVIDDIAFQTNILALNAAVEAARAGIHGKGFAVVAEEVRNLAAKSANAAKETTELIEGSIESVNSGTGIANKTAESLKSIVESVEEAHKIVSEISSSSAEQANAVAQINNALDQLSKVVQQNSATAEQTAASSEELSSQADLLKNMVELLKIKKEC
jgi:methyl-accepting chemotaxis protein